MKKTFSNCFLRKNFLILEKYQMNHSDKSSDYFNSPSYFSNCRKQVSFFRYWSCKKGHSLMRRTQLSWDKLKKRKLRGESLVSKSNCPINNDYLAASIKKQRKVHQGLEKNQITLSSNSQKQFLQPIENPSKEKQAKIQMIKQKKSKSPLTLGNSQHFNQLSKINCLQIRKQSTTFTRKRSSEKRQNSQNYLNKHKKEYNESEQRLKKPQISVQNQQNLPPLESYEIYKNVDIYTKKRSKSIFMNVSDRLRQSTVQSLSNSILPIFSRKNTKFSQAQGIKEKIILHLDIISSFASYSQQLMETYEEIHDWEQLVFLGYKKFYIQRLKVMRALRGIGPNPFNLTGCEIEKKQINSFKKKLEGIKLVKQIQAENKKISESLRNFYNLIIEKSGRTHINMEEKDNFSTEILRNMQAELQLLKQIGNSLALKRMAKVYRCAFLIAELQGRKIICYEESLNMDDFGFYLHKASKLFNSCFL